MQAQAFSQCLYLEPREEQTNCVIGEVISWPQALWPGSGIMATDVVAGKWYHGHRRCGREVVSWPQMLWPGSGIMATDVVAGKWYHGHRSCGRDATSPITQFAVHQLQCVATRW